MARFCFVQCIEGGTSVQDLHRHPSNSMIEAVYCMHCCIGGHLLCDIWNCIKVNFET